MSEELQTLGRALAERRVEQGAGWYDLSDGGKPLLSDGPVEGLIETERGLELAYDPRFAALREPVRYGHLSCTHCGSEHVDPGDLASDPHKTHLCHGCGKLFPSPEGYVRSVGIRADAEPYDTFNLDTSLDAIVSAAAACGFRGSHYQRPVGIWDYTLVDKYAGGQGYAGTTYSGTGDTPALAALRALTAAVEVER